MWFRVWKFKGLGLLALIMILIFIIIYLSIYLYNEKIRPRV